MRTIVILPNDDYDYIYYALDLNFPILYKVELFRDVILDLTQFYKNKYYSLLTITLPEHKLRKKIIEPDNSCIFNVVSAEEIYNSLHNFMKFTWKLRFPLNSKLISKLFRNVDCIYIFTRKYLAVNKNMFIEKFIIINNVLIGFSEVPVKLAKLKSRIV
ncbi:MAG: hypothetical protein DRN12_05750 [Thermoplasmata archaeon]|nr:MAG: hypothetical protein DRN12_05750 [Thermoplasmata archaeon]